MLSCADKIETSVPFTPVRINSSSIGWYTQDLMPFPVIKSWNEVQNENKHLYIRGAYPKISGTEFKNFNSISKSIPQKEIDLVSDFASQYHDSFLKNQFASTNYGYNISYFDFRLISIPYTFFSNFGGSSPEDLVSVLNYDFKKEKTVLNKELFSPYDKFLKEIAEICKNSLTRQFKNPKSTNSKYIEFLASKYDKELIVSGTDPSNEENYKHIMILKKGITVFFLSEQICKSNSGIWEVFIPYEDISQFTKFKINENAYSEIDYPNDLTIYAENGSFLLHYPSTPIINPNRTNRNVTVSPDNSHAEGSVNFYLPVTFPDNRKTNFAQAYVTISWDNLTAFKPDSKENKTKSTIDGIEFDRYEYSDAAVGNDYEIVSFIGNCLKMNYKLDITIHSTNIENYDPGTVEPFDRSSVIEEINTVFATFQFR